jgi:hypothetical protein
MPLSCALPCLIRDVKAGLLIDAARDRLVEAAMLSFGEPIG